MINKLNLIKDLEEILELAKTPLSCRPFNPENLHSEKSKFLSYLQKILTNTPFGICEVRGADLIKRDESTFQDFVEDEKLNRTLATATTIYVPLHHPNPSRPEEIVLHQDVLGYLNRYGGCIVTFTPLSFVKEFPDYGVLDKLPLAEYFRNLISEKIGKQSQIFHEEVQNGPYPARGAYGSSYTPHHRGKVMWR